MSFKSKTWSHMISATLDIQVLIFFCLLCPEQRKHVVFGSETEESDSLDYEPEAKEVDTNDKEDEFKKVFIVGFVD